MIRDYEKDELAFGAVAALSLAALTCLHIFVPDCIGPLDDEEEDEDMARRRRKKKKLKAAQSKLGIQSSNSRKGFKNKKKKKNYPKHKYATLFFSEGLKDDE